MQLSNIPAKIAAIFAASAPTGYKNTIPLTQAGIALPGQASFDVGFPSVTMQPAAAGGVNPFGQDFNGLGYALSGPMQWVCAGGSFPFDPTFAGTIGGYAQGATLPFLGGGTGMWVNTADNNSTDPSTANTTWVPAWVYGTYTQAVTSPSTVMLPERAARPIITLTGTLTSNTTVTVPAWIREWVIRNNTTQGAYTLTLQTPSGTGVALAPGVQRVRGDGTNIVQYAESIAAATTATQAMQFGQMSGVVGQSRNVVMSVTAAAATATLTADEVIVETGIGGLRYCVSSVNLSINLATTGIGGMDTGSAPTSGYVGIYLGYNPTTGAAGLFAQNATSATLGQVYGGANRPSGYTATALISVWPTNGSGQFKIGYQTDRDIFLVSALALQSAGQKASPTSFSVSSVIPRNAKSMRGSIGATCPTSQAISTTISGDANGIGLISASASPSTGFSSNFDKVPVITAQTLYCTATTAADTPTINITCTGYAF